MSKALWRLADWLARELEAEEPLDFTGWTSDQKLLWEARNGLYEQAVAKANEAYRLEMVTAEKAEGERESADQSVAQSDVAVAPSQDGSPDGSPVVAPDPQPEPEAPKPWWEEKARWSHRGPEDYDWDDKPKGYECEYEYDPLEKGWQEIRRSWR
jgi:hypothetical protein